MAADQRHVFLAGLSELGQRLSFPSGSILVQAAQNRDTTYNGSAGVTMQEGKCMHLSAITEHFGFTPSDVVQYSQSDGSAALRDLYKARISVQNNLEPTLFGQPVITNGVTHAL